MSHALYESRIKLVLKDGWQFSALTAVQRESAEMDAMIPYDPRGILLGSKVLDKYLDLK